MYVYTQVDLPKFKAGDLVRISGDMEKVQSLQHGHGDWSDGVLLVRGKEILMHLCGVQCGDEPQYVNVIISGPFI